MLPPLFPWLPCCLRSRLRGPHAAVACLPPPASPPSLQRLLSSSDVSSPPLPSLLLLPSSNVSSLLQRLLSSSSSPLLRYPPLLRCLRLFLTSPSLPRRLRLFLDVSSSSSTSPPLPRCLLPSCESSPSLPSRVSSLLLHHPPSPQLPLPGEKPWRSLLHGFSACVERATYR